MHDSYFSIPILVQGFVPWCNQWGQLQCGDVNDQSHFCLIGKSEGTLGNVLEKDLFMKRRHFPNVLVSTVLASQRPGTL